MTEAERIDHLVKVVAGNNARRFAEKTGIRPESLSRARNGRNRPSTYFERILAAYPDVSREWLYEGVGDPLKSTAERSEVLVRLEALEREVARLARLIEGLKDGL